MAGRITKKAVWQGENLAESNDFVLIEGNVYFSESSINKALFKDSDTSTHCPWKSDASYYTIDVDRKESKDAAWYYATPKDAAKEIKNRVVFWKRVEVSNA